MLARIFEAVHDAVALVLPVACTGCGAPDRSVCGQCRSRLVPEPRSRVLEDGTTIVSALRYEGVVRQCIIGLKENGRTDAARYLAPALAAAAEAALLANPQGDSLVLVCAVPSRRASFGARGYSPVSLLCRLGLGIRPRAVLAQRDGRVSQKSLGREGRTYNAGGAFAAVADVAGRRVMIVDDVVTTGATILDAARAIREAGGYVIAAAVVADTPLMREVG
ncbi:ComF family protein [Salinibacterium hongtaonis]|uniref:ComF family protein n=1 Tax=Homoserinimonas hongtaonis TaxID=2079791 RepID=UPI000D38F72E|nr:phosphoribosyltransferase family protein [Salinibacterium hongtaonis]AWB88672.1 hypothetical protein C2138_03110 [Salinibacterium hongtaonis]